MKKTMRKMLAGILAAAVAVTCALPVYAADPSEYQPPMEQPSDNPNVELPSANGIGQTVGTSTDGTSTVKDVVTKKENVTLSATVTVNGVKYTNTKLGKGVFKNSPKVKNVTVPTSFTDITAQAFKGSNVSSVAIKGNSKKATVLGKNVFKGSKVKNVTLGTKKKGKVKLSNGAFDGAKKNMNIVFNASKSSNVIVGAKTFKSVNTKKMTIRLTHMSKAEARKMANKLKKAGFKGTIKA